MYVTNMSLWRCETSQPGRFQSSLLNYVSDTQSSRVNGTCVQLMTHKASTKKQKVEWLEKPFSWLWTWVLCENPCLASGKSEWQTYDGRVSVGVSVCVCWMTPPPPGHLCPDTDRYSVSQRKHSRQTLCSLLSVSETEEKGWLNTWLASLKKGKRHVNPDKPDIWEDVGVSLTTDNSSIVVTLNFHTWATSKAPKLSASSLN